MRLPHQASQLKLRIALAVLTLAFCFTDQALGQIVISCAEVGSDVVCDTPGGALSTSGLTGPSTGPTGFGSVVFPTQPGVLLGPVTAGSLVDVYAGATVPGAFGSGGLTVASFGSGPFVGSGSSDIIVPTGYVSGASIAASSATFQNASLASLGIVPGTYVWTWGGGASDQTLTLVAKDPALGPIIITCAEVGSDVVCDTPGGALSTSGLTGPSTGPTGFGSVVFPTQPGVLLGPVTAGSLVDVYAGATVPGAFGSGGLTVASFGSGPFVGSGSSDIIVPTGYVSGAPIAASSATFQNASLASLGIVPGTYVWAWGGGTPNQTLTLVLVGAVPVPAIPRVGLLTLLVLLLAAGAYSYRRHQGVG